MRTESRATAPTHRDTSLRYLTVLACSGLLLALLLAVLGAVFQTPLTSIARIGDPAWYRDYGGQGAPEINDQDFLYQNIGPSIGAVRAADIVILGPSFTAHAFDASLLKAFGAAAGVTFYNMSFIGIRGGEFSRRIAARWSIHPRLWIINVDDQLIHFFSTSTDLTIGANREPIPTLGIGRLHALLRVAARTLRWRVQDRLTGQLTPGDMYRNAQTGAMDYDVFPAHVASDNKPLIIRRDPDCHATPETIATGRTMLDSLGGAAVFVLVPHSNYCPQQARELAAALDVPLILTSPDGYTSVDGGGHLDKRSAVLFTTQVLEALPLTSAFARAFGSRTVQAAPATTDH